MDTSAARQKVTYSRGNGPTWWTSSNWRWKRRNSYGDGTASVTVYCRRDWLAGNSIDAGQLACSSTEQSACGSGRSATRKKRSLPIFPRGSIDMVRAKDRPDSIALHLSPTSQRPISPLETGPDARPGKVIVFSAYGLWRISNTDINA